MIYVDDMRFKKKVGRYYAKWSHLAAIPFNDKELFKFAKKIDLKNEWFQDKPGFPHFDVTERMRQKAIKHGAIPVNIRELHRLVKEYRMSLKPSCDCWRWYVFLQCWIDSESQPDIAVTWNIQKAGEICRLCGKPTVEIKPIRRGRR